MKALKPSHREKKRYLLLSGKDANQKNIDESILRFAGILGYAKACPNIVKKTGKKAILCINRSELEKVRAAIMLGGYEIHIEKISGMIGKVK